MKLISLRYLTVMGFKNVWVHRLMSLASILVLSVCMLMVGFSVVAIENVQNLIGRIEKQNVIMVFFNDSLSRDETQALTNTIADIDNVHDAQYISKEQGLERQKATMGEQYAVLFDWLGNDNPLPDAAQVSMKDLSLFDSTIHQIKSLEGVDHIDEQRDLAVKLTAINQMIGVVGVTVVLFLLFISIFVVGNTIRITMYARKLEINIMKAVGATNSFVRFPFIIEGVVLGLSACVLSFFMLSFFYKIALKLTQATLQFSVVPFTSYMGTIILMFLGIGIGVGVIGSMVSIGKYLRREGSEFNAIT